MIFLWCEIAQEHRILSKHSHSAVSVNCTQFMLDPISSMLQLIYFILFFDREHFFPT